RGRPMSELSDALSRGRREGERSRSPRPLQQLQGRLLREEVRCHGNGGVPRFRQYHRPLLIGSPCSPCPDGRFDRENRRAAEDWSSRGRCSEAEDRTARGGPGEAEDGPVERTVRETEDRSPRRAVLRQARANSEAENRPARAQLLETQDGTSRRQRRQTEDGA